MHIYTYTYTYIYIYICVYIYTYIHPKCVVKETSRCGCLACMSIKLRYDKSIAATAKVLPSPSVHKIDGSLRNRYFKC